MKNRFPAHHRLMMAMMVVLPMTYITSVHAQATKATDQPASTVPNATKKPKKKVTTLNGVIVTTNTVSASDGISAGALGTLSAVNTPFSITTVSAADLQKTQAVTLGQALGNDAAIGGGGSDYSPFTNQLNIRGLPLDIDNGVKIDGIPFESYGVNLPLSLMDQVQVLKGSAAFMYGFGAPGGTINYVTRKAPDDGTILSVDAGYRSSNIYSEHVDFGTRFGRDGKYGVRVNYEHENGNNYAGTHVKGIDNASIAFDARLTSQLTWSVTTLYQNGRSEGLQPAAFYTTDTFTDYASNRAPNPISGSARVGSPSTFMNDRFLYAATSLDWKFNDDWKLDLTVAHTKLSEQDASEWIYFTSANGDYFDSPYAESSVDTYKYAQLMLTGKFETGPLEHNLTTGLSYQDHSWNGGEYEDFESDVFTGNIYSSRPGVWSEYTGPLAPVYNEIQRSIFASDTLHWGDRWMAILGARYIDYYEKDWTASETSSGVSNSVSSTYQKHPISPTAALMYKPTRDSTVYASFVQSLEQGSVVGKDYTNAGQSLAPIVSKQHEIGYKVENRSFDASIAVFRLDRGAEYQNAANAYVSGGKERFEGVDASVKWYGGDNFVLGASVVGLRSKYQAIGDSWLVGKRVFGTAPRSMVIFGSYNFTQLPGLQVFGNVRYNDKSRVANNIDTETSVDTQSYTLVNLGLNYKTRIKGKYVTFGFNVNNAFNKRYWSVGAETMFIGAPREYMFNVKVDLF